MLRRFQDFAAELMTIITLVTCNALNITQIVIVGVVSPGGLELLDYAGSNVIINLVQINLNLYINLGHL